MSFEPLDYLVEKTGGRQRIEHITVPDGWDTYPLGTLPPTLMLGRARILVEIFNGRWPSEN